MKLAALTLLAVSALATEQDAAFDDYVSQMMERQAKGETMEVSESSLDESIQAKHSHGPHGHSPHFHAPHYHSPHFHNPHGHNPHSHNPHSHNPHSHNPHSHSPHFHSPHFHSPHRHCPHDHSYAGTSCTKNCGGGTLKIFRQYDGNTLADGCQYTTNQNHMTVACNDQACPTPSPTPFPTPHPCDDGSHGCDSRNGMCYKQSGNGWSCGCKSGYWCSNGCSQPHVAHNCILTTASPTNTPTPYPTPYPTPSPTFQPTSAPTVYACEKTSCTYTKHTNEDGAEYYRTDILSSSHPDTENFACERVAGTMDCACMCGRDEYECTLTHHSASGSTKTFAHCEN